MQEDTLKTSEYNEEWGPLDNFRAELERCAREKICFTCKTKITSLENIWSLEQTIERQKSEIESLRLAQTEFLLPAGAEIASEIEEYKRKFRVLEKVSEPTYTLENPTNPETAGWNEAMRTIQNILKEKRR